MTLESIGDDNHLIEFTTLETINKPLGDRLYYIVGSSGNDFTELLAHVKSLFDDKLSHSAADWKYNHI